MKRILPLLFLLAASWVEAQPLKMRDVMAEAPDTIFPLMTKNNRLDCIDFIENNMPARVKNVFEDYVELTALTADFLSIRLSQRSSMQVKMLPRESDTLLCVVRTYLGPAPDSDVTFYDMRWHPVSQPELRPSVDAFLSDVPSLQTESDDSVRRTAEAAIDALGFLRGLTLVSASLSADAPTLTFELQTAELPRDQRQAIAPRLHLVVMQWDGTSFQPTFASPRTGASAVEAR